ncbi:LPS assembly lipoprotein LptE [Helicobacter sp. 23-1045]
MRAVFSLICAIIFATNFSGCGYYPMSYFVKKSLGENIYVESVVNLSDPENSLIAKDALNQAIAQKFHLRLVDKESADTIIRTEITAVSVDSIADNDAGFANFYRASVTMSFDYTDKNGNARRFQNYGFYDFPVDVVSTITDETRFNAIKEASISAIDKFIAQVAFWQ